MSFKPKLDKTYSFDDIALEIWNKNKDKYIIVNIGIGDESDSSFLMSEHFEIFDELLKSKEINSVDYVELLDDDSIMISLQNKSFNKVYYLFGINEFHEQINEFVTKHGYHESIFNDDEESSESE